MEMIGYILLLIVAVLLVIGMIWGFVQAFPHGVVGLIAVVGIGLLFAKAVKERLRNREDDHYSKNVQK